MTSNMPPGYSDGGDCANHGRETVIYQELQDVRLRFSKWLNDNRKDMPSVEDEEVADKIDGLLDALSFNLNQPL